MIRNNAFWFFDRIRGGKLTRSLEEISLLMRNPDSSEAIDRKNTLIKSLLCHATENITFYRQYKSFKSLHDFPVINKNLIRSNYQDFFFNGPNTKNYKKISTSGSTGIPFLIHQDPGKVLRNQADSLYFMQLCGYRIGDPLYYLRIWNEVNKKSRLSFFAQNIIPVDISELSEKSIYGLKRTLDNMPDNAVVLAYGSTFEILAGFFEKKSLVLNSSPKIMFAMSDAINQSAKLFITNKFKSPLYSRYSNAENGFLGHQFNQHSDDYLINTASYYIELLNFDSDDQVEDGNPGRVVVTDLFNCAVPLIRYDTGDIAIKGESHMDKAKVQVFKSIEGRKLDFIFNSAGSPVSPHSIDYALRSLEKLVQFQLIQKEKKKYLLKLLVNKKDEQMIETSRKRLKIYLGNDAEIEVVFTDEIPVMQSGKRKIVVNEMTI